MTPSNLNQLWSYMATNEGASHCLNFTHGRGGGTKIERKEKAEALS